MVVQLVTTTPVTTEFNMEEEKKQGRKNRMDIQKQKQSKFSPDNNGMNFNPLFTDLRFA